MNPRAGSITRRTALLGLGLACVGVGRARAADDPIDRIKAKARAARMDPFEVFDSKNFRAIGDAPARYIRDALEVCEDVATDYRKLFKEKGFTLDWPTQPMTVVVLAGPQSYAAFEGGFVDEAIGGHYDLTENRLVTFDYRQRDPRAKVGAIIPQEDNTLALVHETMHLLTFNTGLLDRKGDVPLVVSEGLATYGETWRRRGRGTLGANNLRRLQGFRAEQKPGGVGWIPFEKLLTQDKLLDASKPGADPATLQVGYFEAWRFAHRMLSNPARAAKFRDYLGAIRGEADPSRRVEVARQHLGDLDKLDAELAIGLRVNRGPG